MKQNIIQRMILSFAIMSHLSSASSKFTNVKNLTNPIKTLVVRGEHTPKECLFGAPIPVGLFDLTDGVWLVKVGNVFIQDLRRIDATDNMMTIFQIKSNCVRTQTKPQELPLPQHPGSGGSCDVPLRQVLLPWNSTNTYYLPSSVSIAQTLWEHNLVFQNRVPFYLIHPTEVGNEWYTVSEAEKDYFQYNFEQHPDVTLPMTIDFKFKFEITFLFQRMV